MATKSKMTLAIELEQKMFGKGLESLNKLWDRTMGKMQRKYQDLIREIPGLDKAMRLITNPWAGLIAGGAAFISMTKKAVDATAAFDHSFLTIRQINLEKPREELEAYRKQIRDAAFETGTNLKESTDAVFALQSATGIYGKEAIEVFKQVGTYSLAVGADIGDAMDSTTKAMKAFGLSAADVGDLLESNAKAVKVGITSYDALAKVQTTYAGAASTAAQSIDTANKLFAVFTSIGKNSEQSANMTKTFFEGLQQQAEEIEDILNVQVFDDGQMRQADEIIKDISARFSTMNDREIAQTISMIGGPQGLRAALGKAATSAEGMFKTFADFDSSSFSLKDAMENAAGDFETQKQIFGNRIEALMTKWGEKIMPMIGNLFDKLTPVLEWLYENFDNIIRYGGLFIGILGGLKIAMLAFNAVAAANPIGLIVVAVVGLIVLVKSAIDHFHSWGSTVLALMGPFGMIISFIVKLRENWDSVVDAFKSDGIIGALKRIGQVALDVLLEPVQKLLGWVGELTGWDWAQNASGGVEALRRKMDLITPEEEKEKTKDKEEKETTAGSLFGDPTDYSGEPTTSGGDLSQDINKTVRKANQVKTVNVTVDSVMKGDLVLARDDFEGMTKNDLERYLIDLFGRLIANADAI